MLTQLSQMLLDNPEISDVDLNPVLVSESSVSIVDSQVHLVYNEQHLPRRFAISPYPKELEEKVTLKDGQTIIIRPIVAEDEATQQVFDNASTQEDRYKRYFSQRGKMSHEEMARLTQIDYEREMAFIAIRLVSGEEKDTLAVIRASIDPDNIDAEFAMIVRSDAQGLGLGRLLLEKLIIYQRAKGTRYLSGMTMLSNIGMASLAKKVGFSIEKEVEEGIINMRLELNKK
jgi:acetyltransferase